MPTEPDPIALARRLPSTASIWQRPGNKPVGRYFKYLGAAMAVRRKVKNEPKFEAQKKKEKKCLRVLTNKKKKMEESLGLAGQILAEYVQLTNHAAPSLYTPGTKTALR